MRLSDRTVIQLIERDASTNDFVLVDDEHGTEIVLTTNELARLHYAIRYFAGVDHILTGAITDAAVNQPWSGR